jgi:peptidoglycan-associated lipoprotein
VELAVQTFRLKRKGEKENQPLKDCTIGIIDVTEKTSKNVEEKTNPATNSFAFNLEPDKSYVLIASAPGYRPDTLALSTLGIKKTTKVEKKFTLRLLKKEPEYDTIRINEPIRLDNILYDFNDDKIRTDAEPDLQYLADMMSKNPEMKIELSSHTDARGNDAYNEDLSQRRAESAKRWLVTKGIGDARIVAKGYGEKVLLNKCVNGVECTEEEHQLNRRTEFKIIAGPTSIVTEKIEKREKKPAAPAPTGGKQSLGGLQFLQQLIESANGNPADRELKFKTERFDFNEVKEGEFVKYEYVFDNIGNNMLEIDMVSACECMEVKWTADKIQPGKQGRVEVIFNTLSFKGDVSWDIDVVFKNTDADGFPLVKRVLMVGKIR